MKCQWYHHMFCLYITLLRLIKYITCFILVSVVHHLMLCVVLMKMGKILDYKLCAQLPGGRRTPGLIVQEHLPFKHNISWYEPLRLILHYCVILRLCLDDGLCRNIVLRPSLSQFRAYMLNISETHWIKSDYYYWKYGATWLSSRGGMAYSSNLIQACWELLIKNFNENIKQWIEHFTCYTVAGKGFKTHQEKPYK